MKKGLSFLCAFALIVATTVTVPTSNNSTGYTIPTTREHMMGS